KDPSQALTAEAVDIMLGLLAKARMARKRAQQAIAQGFVEGHAALQLLARIAAFVPGLFDQLRQKGATIGFLKFRLAVADHAGGGKEVEAWLEGEALLPPSWRLRLEYDEDHPDEMADFAGEIAASLPNVFYTDRYVSIAWPIGSETARMHALTAH